MGLSEILLCIAWYMVVCMRMVEMSFIEVSAECHFPIQNLPYGIFSTASNVRGRVRVSKDLYILHADVVLPHTALVSSAGEPSCIRYTSTSKTESQFSIQQNYKFLTKFYMKLCQTNPNPSLNNVLCEEVHSNRQCAEPPSQ